MDALEECGIGHLDYGTYHFLAAKSGSFTTVDTPEQCNVDSNLY
jgi:hypothetical protein